MSVIVLKDNPKIEIQLLDNGFELIDGETEQNSGFHLYNEVQTIELNNTWFPRLAKWLRAITWILNGVPFFPDAKSYKKATLVINLENTKLGIWLTDTNMTDKAKRIKELLDEKTNHNIG